jgi:predicted metal-dependent HD superfamily phosphohydrolase
MEEAVEATWNILCADLALPRSLAATWWKGIHTEYTKPYRHYHTLQHLSEFLGHYSAHKDLISDRHSFLLAIFFHDLIYEPMQCTNEDDSIQLFKLFVQDCHSAATATAGEDKVPKCSAAVIQLIELTKTHECGQSMALDSQLFCDMDMAILGASEERYGQYSGQVCPFSTPPLFLS